MSHDTDVVIIGGGPAGATVGALLRRYAPDLNVLILERARFPRDHVGESQLPLIGAYLDEMGVWDEVEAAGFPIKVGATYRWGRTPDLWHFNFLPHGDLLPEARPARYEGQRTRTAFQVDRAIYDDILLRHAGRLGCEVRQETRVRQVQREGDRVEGLELDDGTWVRARHYVDATGGGGLLRRAMGVEVDAPTALRNVAIWDYWQNARWAEEIGVGGTRVQVLSLGYGWIWFIPLGPSRTSVGLIVPAAYHKAAGRKPAELYAQALGEEPRIRELLEGASSENKLQTTNDWSFVADRLAGENWFLVGDACGFADPILAAGMTLAHGSAREVAYTILELERGRHDPAWLRSSYDEGHRRRIRQHIAFADYWYSANGCFTDLVANTAEIARTAGLSLSPDEAFQWLGTGGFANDDIGTASIGTYTVPAVKRLLQMFAGSSSSWRINGMNEFRLVKTGVREELRASYHEGAIHPHRVWIRGDRQLRLVGPFLVVATALEFERELEPLRRRIAASVGRDAAAADRYAACLAALESMVVEGWVVGRHDKRRPLGFALKVEDESESIQLAATPTPTGVAG